MRILIGLTLTAVLFVGCRDSKLPLSPELLRPQANIWDGANSGGNPHFYFLQPMVSNPNRQGDFDAAVAPTVQICVLSGSACGSAGADVIATYTTRSGPGSETVRVNVSDEHYIVNWHTDRFSLDPSKHYRIRVLVSGAEVGHADVDVVSTGKEVESVSTSEYIGLVNGRTLPIKFRIEQGMVVGVSVSPDAVTVAVGESVQLEATVTDAHGNTVTGRSVAWSSSDAATSSVDDDGKITGNSPGAATITATVDGMQGAATVTVEDCLAVRPMLGLWGFREGAGITTADLSGNGHTGILHGTPSWAGGAKGVGTGLAFENPEDLVNVGSFLSEGATALTVAAWVNPTSFSNIGDIQVGGVSGPRIISATDGGGWSLGHAPGSGGIQIELRGIVSFTTSATYPVGEWAHVAFVYNGASVSTYLNGEVVDSRSAPAGTVLPAASCTFIGNEPEGCTRQTNGNFAWQGQIDEVVVYGRALTHEEVRAVHRQCLK